MRRLLASLLILCVLYQSASKAVICINWLIKQDYIAKNLCENRFTPCKHCAGKCQLNKQLQKDDESQGKVPATLKDKSENEVFCEMAFSGFGTSNSIEHLFTPLLITGQSGVPSGTFRPPGIIG